AKYKTAISERRKQKYHANLEESRRRGRIYAHNAKGAKQKRYREWFNRLGEEGRMDLRILRRYGLSLEKYNEMGAHQGGVCEICEMFIPSGGHKRLSIDHCHRTKKVRGLLCNMCNQGLGHFYDDPKRLHRAIAYLNQS